MSQNQAVFVEGNLMRHVIVMSLTSSIGLMAMFAVDLVDMVFLGLLGETALAAAAGYAGTVLFFTNSINIGFSIAAGALVARAIGEDKEVEGREYATSVAIFVALIGVFVPLLALPNIEFLLGLVGAQGEVQILATSYLRIVMPTMVIIGLAMVAMAVLRAHGAARASMMALILGGVVNAVLDPILIFGMNWGLEGAAAATAISRFFTVGAALYMVHKNTHGFAPLSIGLIRRDFAPVSSIAAPAVLANIATPIGAAIVTREMARYGADAVAAMAVIGRLTPVAFAIVLALSGAIGPIIGQNRGAGQYERVREAYKEAIKFAALYVLGAALILFILRGLISDLFGLEGEARELIYLFCGPLAISYIFIGVIFVSNASFNNLGRAGFSTMINWGKNTLGTWPLVVAGSALWGAKGILIGQAMGAVIFALIALIMARAVMRDPDESDHAHFAGHRMILHHFTTRH